MRLAVLGDPVKHSLSPALHQAALRATGIPGEYLAMEVDEEGFRAAMDELRTGGLDGANVTMPHKRLAALLADRLSADAARAGAANTMVRVAGTIVGHNTDIAGIRDTWRRAGFPAGSDVLVLGSGGAAAAALLALETLDVGRLYVSSRRPGAAQELASSCGVAATALPWGTGTEAVVVNATPLGMNGEPLPAPVMDQAAGLYDMPYGTAPTPAMETAAARSLPAVSGHEMLVAQAVSSFRLWTGRAPSVEAMEAALRGELAGRRAAEKR